MNHLRFSTLALLLAGNLALLLPGCSSDDDTTPDASAGAAGTTAGGAAGSGGAGAGGTAAGSGGSGGSKAGSGGSAAGTGGSSAGSGGTAAGAGGTTAGAGGTSGGSGGKATNPAEVAGPADTHCDGTTPVVVDAATCSGSGGEGGAGDAGAGGEGGAGDAGAAGAGDAGAGGAGDAGAAGQGGAGGDCQNTDPEYGDILYGSEGKDDDCKYAVTWSSSAAVAENQSVTLSLTATYLADGKPVTGATPRAEIFLPCDLSHPPPAIDFNATATETSPGHYTIGPVQFDKSGHWAVRFHLFESCEDGPQSPHGHASFYVNVP